MKTSWLCSADRSWPAACCQSMPAAGCGCTPRQNSRLAGAASPAAMMSESPPHSMLVSMGQRSPQRQRFFAGAATTEYRFRRNQELTALAAAAGGAYDGRRHGVRRGGQSLHAQPVSVTAAGDQDGGRHLLSMLGQMMAGMQAQQPAPTGSHLSVRSLSFQPAGALCCGVARGSLPLPWRKHPPRLGPAWLCCMR